LQRMASQGSQGNSLSAFEYTYAPAGEIRTVVRSIPQLGKDTSVYNFAYDDALQLIGAGGLAYAFDANGNRTAEQLADRTVQSIYNNLNQLVGYGDTLLTYDASGNLLSDGTRTFEWDAQNQLVAVATGTHRSEFSYNG